MARFLCTGDDQIGAGADLGLTPGERLADQEACWKWRVELAHELKCDALLYAGDAFERDVPTPEEYEAFARPARASGIPLVAISGNGRHDGAKRTPNALERVRDTKLLQVYRTPGVREIAGVSIVMLPWAPVDHWVASTNGGDRDAINRHVAEAILDVARGLYADATKPAILLGHWHVDAATTASGMGVGEVVREPLLNYAALEAIGFDAIVLGHNHKPQMLGERGFHVGSPMAVNFGEAGYEHVVWLLDVNADGGMQAFQIPVPGRRLVNLHVAADEMEPLPWYDAEGIRDAIVKVKIRATEEQARRFDVGKVKTALLEDGAYMVAGIAVDVTREAKNAVAVDETIGDIEVMEMYLDAQGINGDRLEALLERHVAYTEAAA